MVGFTACASQQVDPRKRKTGYIGGKKQKKLHKGGFGIYQNRLVPQGKVFIILKGKRPEKGDKSGNMGIYPPHPWAFATGIAT